MEACDHVSNRLHRPVHQSKRHSRSSLACNECRSRHLKCDAARPACSRCVIEATPCVYGVSRRGAKGRQDSSARFVLTQQRSGQMGQENSYGSFIEASEVDRSISRLTGAHVSSGPAEPTRPSNRPEKLQALNLYYDNFHGCHPFILPRLSLDRRLNLAPDSLMHLLPVVEYVGCVYASDFDTSALRSLALENLASSSDLSMDGFTVQALLLLAIATHCSDEYKIADQLLDQALHIALSIGMNRQSFATIHGENDGVIEESWRRTYWTLFIMDSLFAVINHRQSHRLQGVISDVDLPCEDVDYEAGNIPISRSLADYDSREFELDEIVFSSFTYLIDAGRIVSSLLGKASYSTNPRNSCLSASDAMILNWSLHLPERKATVIDENRELDEVLFLAHRIFNTEKLQLHRPRSELTYSKIETMSACTPPYIQADLTPLPGAYLHTAISLEVFEAMADILSAPCQHNKHSPIFICALALITMAQVSACNHLFPQGSPDFNTCRERIRLYLGILKTHEPRWALAKRSVRELKSVAKQLLSIRSAPEALPSTSRTDMILTNQPPNDRFWDVESFDNDTIALLLAQENDVFEPSELR